MTTTTSGARKKPQDRRPKQTKQARELPDDRFEWTDDTGHTWVSDKPIAEVMTPGLFRRNRASDLIFIMEAVEQLFPEQPEILDIFDQSWDAANAIGEALMEKVQEMGASMGESARSST